MKFDVNHPRDEACNPVEEAPLNEVQNLEIDLLLEAIYRLSGYDFREYMRSSIQRRLIHRMQMDKLATITQVLDRLLRDRHYLQLLLNDFSINVTEMFRDPSFFYALRQKVLPILGEQPEIRIWHAGCSTGEEVYSMAILLAEEGLADKTIIYATDMNEDVLQKAEKGVFPLRRMQSYTKNYMLAGGLRAFSEYYKTDDHVAYMREFLRKNIVFAQHNLVNDSSFNEFDLIICRNVLIYFDKNLQNRVFQLFTESLRPAGFLGLGNKETLTYAAIADQFQDFDHVNLIYQKTGRASK